MKNLYVLLFGLVLATAGHSVDNRDKIIKILDNTFKTSKDKDAFCARGGSMSGSIRKNKGFYCGISELSATIALKVCPWMNPADENNLFYPGPPLTKSKNPTKCGAEIVRVLGLNIDLSSFKKFVPSVRNLAKAFSYDEFKNSSPATVCAFITSISLSAGTRCIKNM